MKTNIVKEPQLTLYSQHKEKLSSIKPFKSLIEEDSFPFEELSRITTYESHRKDIYRPIYHIHKWWAQRLGSVFRAIIIGATIDKTKSLIESFYDSVDLSEITVFDPFMGSGTTVGEAHKLGCTALGRDINSLAFHSVKNSLSRLNKLKIEKEFNKLEQTIGKKIKSFYTAYDKNGDVCETLYYFWVKTLPCPSCSNNVELFSSYIFAKHAYVKKFPKVQIYCPCCSNIFEGNFGDTNSTCPSCNNNFNPHQGPVNKTTAHCSCCNSDFTIAKVAKSRGVPPDHKMYAKLVLKANGEKEYVKIDQHDLSLYDSLSKELLKIKSKLPTALIEPGYNTKQVLNYGYTKWIEFFNDRQLQILLLLAEAIKEIKDEHAREALKLMFSAILDFNNMFASYKGEGTGAVRHMFSHHILKPERIPIEANLWGTPKSSGSFSTLFKTRLLRAIEYQKNPFEVIVGNGGNKVFNLSKEFSEPVSIQWPPKDFSSSKIHVSCGSSEETSLPDQSVDLVVTDPPFFDNVHYSELADFFYVWHELLYDLKSKGNTTTRSTNEVQDVNADEFSRKLGLVFKECHRILVPNGLMIFTYHHSRKEGWTSLANAIVKAGFNIVQSHPVKSEMSVATPKLQAKSPIDYDIVLVCKRKEDDVRNFSEFQTAIKNSKAVSKSKISRLFKTKLPLSQSDITIIVKSELLKALSAHRSVETLIDDFNKGDVQLEEFCVSLYSEFKLVE